MQVLQWLTVITAAFVAWIAFLQWRTAQQKAVLDLFDKRFKVYEAVKNCVDQVSINPRNFENEIERDFIKAMNEAYFLFGGDIHDYLWTLRKAMLSASDDATKYAQNMEYMKARSRIQEFYEIGQSKFAEYMR